MTAVASSTSASIQISISPDIALGMHWRAIESGRRSAHEIFPALRSPELASSRCWPGLPLLEGATFAPRDLSRAIHQMHSFRSEPANFEEHFVADARQFASGVFESVDVKDVERFASYLSEDSTFVFGNAEPVISRIAISRYVEEYLARVRETAHDLFDVWQIGDVIIVRLCVTYTRHDDEKLSYPCVTVWRMKDGLITDYRIYIDNSGLFANQKKAA